MPHNQFHTSCDQNDPIDLSDQKAEYEDHPVPAAQSVIRESSLPHNDRDNKGVELE